MYLEQGLPTREIAKKLNVSRQTVYQRHKRLFPGVSYNKKKYDQFCRLHSTGLFSVLEIAYFLRMRKESIQRFIRRYKND